MDQKTYPHLILYDGECGLCDHTVQFLLKIDNKKLFRFAPLQGPTAQTLLSKLPALPPETDSVILIEDYQSIDPKLHIRGKAIFRILWLEGEGWGLIGWKYFLPAWMYDWAYNIVAKHRKQWVSPSCTLPSGDQQERFLP